MLFFFPVRKNPQNIFRVVKLFVINRMPNEIWPFSEHESFTTLFQWVHLLFINTKGIVYAKELQSLDYSRAACFFISVCFSWYKMVYLS